MNGLRYIRTRCNLSLSELADVLGVTRQALSAWENGKKEIPEQRCEQLANFFGIDKEYFGEISEEKQKYLLEKAMFRYDDNGKETYRFKPQQNLTSLVGVPICFMGEMEMSLDEQFVCAQRKKQETLEKIDDIIKWTDNAGSIQSQSVCINRGCTVYGMINEMMEKMRGMKSYLKMPFYYEMLNVWKAMMMAYGLMDTEDVSFLDKSSYYCGEDGEWIYQMYELIKSHWDCELAFHEHHHEEMELERKQRRDKCKKTEIQNTKSIEEMIADAEEENRVFMKEHPELLKSTNLSLFGK